LQQPWIMRFLGSKYTENAFAAGRENGREERKRKTEGRKHPSK